VRDAFALLGVPRRPWLDAEVLKRGFLSLSGECHPDRLHDGTEEQKRGAQERFTELNKAYQSLLDPRERLLHLAELETDSRRTTDVQDIPPGLMSLFFEVGKICRKADALIAEKTAETSPVLKVQMFARGQEEIEELQKVKRAVAFSREALLNEIKSLDTGWEAMDPSEQNSKLGRLQEIAGLLNYSKKWDAQIEERIVRLSF
jgi:curved DNA-binding protein CbpA